MVSRVIPVDAFDLVVFGATGDLARRKILPALYRRLVVGQIPDEARIIGAARTAQTQKQFRANVSKALDEFAPESKEQPKIVAQFLSMLDYYPIDTDDTKAWQRLAKAVKAKANPIRAFYLSVAPSLFGPLAKGLADAGLADESSRIIIEKPLGHDLPSAKALNAQLRAYFDESQIYRIDHYLGKETVQNLVALRFANALFEPVWNARHIDHVQIAVSEDIGVGGRGGEPDAVRDEKLKVIRSLGPVEPADVVRGQYAAADGEKSFLEDVENPESRTESFLALRVGIENWRWAGTPFYLRTGKKLKRRMSEIAIFFKDPPHSIFPDETVRDNNALIIKLQPEERITLYTTVKEPGPGGMRLIQVPLDMTFSDLHDEETVNVDAYERLILDVIRGNQTLFMRGDEVEAAWAWIDPIEERWREKNDKPKQYDPGSSGPEDALMLMHRDGRRWRDLGA
jgi:glucose-6-phosphate 1-dehydrogenase